MNKIILWNAAGLGIHVLNRLTFPLQCDDRQILCFDPSIETDNLGDQIIMHYCKKVLEEWFPQRKTVHIGTHRMPSEQEESVVRQMKYKFVCGTNLLTSHIEHHWRWILPDGVRRKLNYRNAILLGVGWGEYQDECSVYSRMIYRCMLNPCVYHAVRDQYTLEKLHRAGVKNVINTGCPTTWALTPEFCREIPGQKAKSVVATITDYRQAPEYDNLLLDILSRNYEQIYLWPQGRQDTAYLKTLNIPDNLVIIPRSLQAYEDILRKGDVDYVGTRLHAGIHALNHKVRSIIIAVDNRAAEMGRDINLPVVQRENIRTELTNRINDCFATEIRIRSDKIKLFADQFCLLR